ncbi:unnamed protein product [Owenia fusiformis]|uniref:Uncharacterized protein n=1 Tax=Owenia fusiformis TaxID=6347 RepID=A0A8J1TH22_OWEFU|nr:unnamed protein product [Owenia fusiformis]
MVLKTLEFSDCLSDSPSFRENLHAHEKELEKTSKSIKGLIYHCREVINATKSLSKAQRNLSQNLQDFRWEHIGEEQTDDEIIIARSLKEFGKLIATVEDARDNMLQTSCEQLITPLENFRKDQIGGAKEGKKKFDKQTSKFCQSLERYLSLKTKTNDNALQEADAALEMERRHFSEASMQYVLLIQEVHERKKFEFVETLLTFIYSWLTFYHQGYEVAKEFKENRLTDLQIKIQKTRENFATTHVEAGQLMKKMLEVRGAKQDPASVVKEFTRQGYLYMLEKKALGVGTTWTKYYCQYQKDGKVLKMIPFNQTSGTKVGNTEEYTLTSCTRRAADTIEKRFCFDITVAEKQNTSFTLQALSEDDRKLWLDAMDGKEPIYLQPQVVPNDIVLDDIGFSFIQKCIGAIESRGLDDQGLYRVVGVNSKVSKLTSMGLDRRKIDRINLEDDDEWEIKTITSSLKAYFRSLPEPLMSYKLHHKFITAAKKESKTLRINDIHALVHKLPESNFEMLDCLCAHLQRVASNAEINLMTEANLGVCFGPTLMRPAEETMAAIMDIKFCNIVVEIMIENYEKIFKTPPDGADITEVKVATSGTPNMDIPKNKNPMTSSTYSTDSTGTSPRDSHFVPTNQNQSYAAYRARLRPTAIYDPRPPGDTNSSNSSSSESLNSKASSSTAFGQTPSMNATPSQKPATYASVGSPSLDKAKHTTTAVAAVRPQRQDTSTSLYGSLRKRQSADSLDSRALSSSTGSMSSLSGSGSTQQLPGRRKVRTLYACDAENESELSFEPNQIIYNVKPSKEPGWLEGCLNNKSGLIPANYVEFLN